MIPAQAIAGLWLLPDIIIYLLQMCCPSVGDLNDKIELLEGLY